MYVATYEKAKQQARANADRFGCAYYVMLDTNGNYRVEREYPGEQHTLFVAQPSKEK